MTYEWLYLCNFHWFYELSVRRSFTHECNHWIQYDCVTKSMKSQSNWNLDPDRRSWHQNGKESVIRTQIRDIHHLKFDESLNFYQISRNSIQYASETTPCGLLAYKWSWKVDSSLNFMDFRRINDSLIECARWSRLPGVVGDGPAGHVSNFYFPNCACRKLQTKSWQLAN